MIETITRCLGLVNQYNPLATAAGALIQADNCVCRRENVIEDRRGYASYGTLSNEPTALLPYLNRILTHNGSAISYDNGSGTFADYAGTYAAPSGQKMRFVEAFSNLYVTTDKGVQVLTDVAGTAARKAGAPRPLDMVLSLTGSGFMANNTQVAYAAVIRRTDANSNVLFSYPSQRAWISNTSGGAKNVSLVLPFSSEVITGDVVQIYRTATTAYTAGAGDGAGSELFLVYQYTVTAADVVTGSITFTDSVIDALATKNASLYTNPSQEGQGQANERPPLCKDLAAFKTFMFYANTSTKQRLYITLVGTTGLYNGGAYGKSIKIAGTTYTFAAAENTATGAVKVSVPSIAALDIEETARSLVKVINRYASNTSVYAYYASDADGLPGQILIEERGVGAAAFTAQANDTTAASMFFPEPPVSPATNAISTSSNSVQKNGLFFSKTQQPEAVPALNYLLIGPANKNILRIAPLRDSLIIIKEEGVYRLSGENAQSFVVTPLDLTVFCKAPDSVAVLSNQVFMLSNQGVVAISESGVQVVSREITPNITPLLSSANLASATSGCGYESETSYFLSTITASTDTTPNQTFVYNIFTRTWVRWTFGFNAAIVDPSTDKLFFTKSGKTIVYRERKNFTETDYADPEVSITITGITGGVVSFTLGTGSPEIGWVIEQGNSSIPIAALTFFGGEYQATMASEVPPEWVAGPATLFPSVGMVGVWDTWSGGQQGAGLLKQVRESAILTDNIPGNNSATGIVPTFKTNFDEEQEEVAIPLPGGGWGAAWGAIPWGGGGDSYGYRTYVPRNKQICRTMNPGFKHKNAREKIAICGISLVYEVLSERVGK